MRRPFQVPETGEADVEERGGRREGEPQMVLESTLLSGCSAVRTRGVGKKEAPRLTSGLWLR